MHLRYFALPIGIALTLAASWWFVETSDTFHDCIENAQYKSAQTSPPKKPAAVPITFAMRQNCWGHFVEKKADGIIALFTIILAGSTIGLWFSTQSAALAAKAAAEHIPIVERAYVYGGFGSRAINSAKGIITVAVTLANYGKTPAFVTKVDLGFARAEELPSEPSFDFSVPMSEYYFPLMTMNDVRVTMANLTIPDNGDWVVFQRTHYRDVLGNAHFSGCAFRFSAVLDQNIVPHVAEQRVALDTPYWATDEANSKKT